MQMWFEQDNLSIINLKQVKHFHKKIKYFKVRHKMSFLKTFNVEAETTEGQCICVTGNCKALGNWEVNSAVILSNSHVTRIRNNKTYHVWCASINLPSDREIVYRYFNAYVFKSDEDYGHKRHMFVNSWESHYEPRVVKSIDESKMSSSDNKSQCDIYGLSLSDKQQISKGFLTTESAIQFKLYDNPIEFWNSKLHNNKDKISVKMTPIRLSKQSQHSGDTSDFSIDELSSQGFDDVEKHSGWPFVECVSIPDDKCYQLQNQFGILIKKNTFHIIQTKIFNIDQFGYLFDIYLHKGTSEEPPYHVGFTHILPSSMKYSDGIIMSPITSVRHKPIGELKIEYLIIKPAKDIHCNFDKIPDWDSPYIPLDIGHRGSGSTFRHLVSDCSHVRENTIASLNKAATNGADFVECDVQLTKDLVPIIYHDFEVSMAIKSKTDICNETIEMIQIPLKSFYYAQLQKLKIYHNKEPYSLSEDHFLNDPRSEYQPFPKLERVFKDLHINTGINIELKWTMKLQDGTFELDNPFDMNLFVDTILRTVFEFAESRSIVFSCFHPDVCTMLKMKQSRYPVLFLTQGVTSRYPPLADPRCHTIQNAVHHSTCHGFLGVNVHSEDLLRDHTQIDLVKNAGLALFCWGEDNNSKEVLKKFKELGVNAVIYDKLDRNYLMNKKESCITKRPGIYFVARNHCEQDKILLSKEESLNEDTHIRENNDNKEDDKRYFMDVDKAIFQNKCSSTDSLWSEECTSVNTSKSPSRKQKYVNETLETDVQQNISKKSK